MTAPVIPLAPHIAARDSAPRVVPGADAVSVIWPTPLGELEFFLDVAQAHSLLERLAEAVERADGGDGA
jgi:hypothetical protein